MFRLQAKHLLLTYPQCTLSKQELFDFLSLLPNADKILVSSERHQDGSPHLHAYFSFKKKPDLRNERYFDCNGFHPHIKGQSKTSAIAYVTKEDKDPTGNFQWKKISKTEEAYNAIITGNNEGLSNNELFYKAIETDKSLLRCAASVGYFINRIKVPKVDSPPKFNLASFSLHEHDRAFLEAWADTVRRMERGDRLVIKSLWFCGPSMFGKTCLARSLGQHWYMQNMWNLECLSDNDHVYGVLDDIEWESLQISYKGVLGRQEDVSLTDKYKRKTLYKLGYPVIVCTNELPDFSLVQRTWLRENVLFYDVISSILPNKEVFRFTVLTI